MTEQAMDLTVRKTITVEVDQERAFRVFCERHGAWWPLDGKAIGEAKAVDAVLEPRAGGRWYEVCEDGSTCDWGVVRAYEPHDRVLLAWQIGADWQYDPTLETEVEVRFVAEGPGRTRVELEHRGLEAYGPAAGQMHAVFDSADGWGGILGDYAAAAVAG